VLATPFHKISRYHAEIFWREDHYWFCDAGSTHGTLHNGQLTKHTPVRLSEGDVIHIGRWGSDQKVLMRQSRL